MYECPNCGGNLKFHIPSQQLLCAYCEAQFDPYAIQKETDTVDGDCFEANVFLCPQCGGEMISGDNDATSFCSYCGSANILSSRIRRKKRPRYIIPFQITKEDCKKAYKAKMRRAFFVPKALKNPDFIDGFRGIYMPYWSYRISQKGTIHFNGTTEKRRGDYVDTNHYSLTGDLDAGYAGYSCDASANFYDSISEALGPYHVVNRIKDFTPAFLSGFYAETANVTSDVYRQDAEEMAADLTYEKVKNNPVFRKYDFQVFSQHKKAAGLNTQCDGADSAMFPVWFMSYRNGDRVAYATVNGQTGKVVADMPVDGRRFFASSLLLAIPLFFLLNLLLTLRPSVLLACCAVLAAVTAFVYHRELAQLLKLEAHAEDRGLRAQNPKRPPVPKKKKSPKNITVVYLFILLWMSLMIGIPVYAAGVGYVFVWLVVAVAMAIICISGFKKYKRLENLKGGLGFLYSAGAVAIGGLVSICRPVSDLWYYGSVFLILLTVFFILGDLIGNYNRLTMRKLPQFDKKGGDDNA